MLLENKTILVAGAAGLLGSHVVEELLKHGAKVIATDVSQELVAQRLSALGLNIDTDTDTNTDSADVKCQALNLLDEKRGAHRNTTNDDLLCARDSGFEVELGLQVSNK